MPSTVSPYHFEDIPKLSKRQVEIQNALIRFFPYRYQNNPYEEVLVDYLKSQFAQEVQIRLDKIEEVQLKSFITALPEQSILLRFSVLPRTNPLFAWLDSDLLACMVDRLLGGKGEKTFEFKSLGEVEQGVLQYLFLYLS